jgi:hypothetical protein
VNDAISARPRLPYAWIAAGMTFIILRAVRPIGKNRRVVPQPAVA